MDGTSVNYVAWAPNEPNFANNDENCVVMYTHTGGCCKNIWSAGCALGLGGLCVQGWAGHIEQADVHMFKVQRKINCSLFFYLCTFKILNSI